ncbi:MAG: AI-2E family transporter [Syntrophales bacterium]|nr:AI-2E family transporter [Syntrophales bacterium]
MEPKKNSNIPFLILLWFVTLLFFWLLKPFFFPIFWAAVIAGIARPLYFRINNRLGRPTLSLSLLFIAIVFVLLVPLAGLGVMIFDESAALYQMAKPGENSINAGFQRIIDAFTDNYFARLAGVNREMVLAKATDAVRSLANYLVIHLTSITQNTLGTLVQFGIMLYTLFFFLRDGERFMSMAAKILPGDEEQQNFLFKQFIATARSTLKATLIIGGIQGAIGAVIFLIAGVKGAFIWGALMVVMSIVPVVGCTIIWAPAGIIMLLLDNVWEGILILAAGFFLISTVDNLLRPILVGRDVEMHPLLIFLSTLGGIALFGFSGFVIGPVVTALLIAVWEMREKFYQKKLYNR